MIKSIKRVARVSTSAAASLALFNERADVVESLAYRNGAGRATIADAIKLAVGPAPKGYVYGQKPETASHKAFAFRLSTIRQRHIIGHLAGSLPGFGNMTEGDARNAAREIVALGNASGTGPLKKGQTGRRNAVQERAYASARQYASELIKHAGYAPAAPSKTPTGATITPKAPVMSKENEDKGDGAPVDATKVTKAKMTKELALEHVDMQASLLLAFANKHAGKLPGEVADMIHKLKAAAATALKPA